jgi:carbon-monoxide dehydrogenase large subunit
MVEQIGKALPRLEDLRLIKGEGRYTNDLSPDGACWSYVVRSPHAHAMLRGMNVDAARRCTGVLAVLTAQDYRADGLRPIRHAANPPDALDPNAPSFVPSPTTTALEWEQPPLAEDRVRYVGEAIALVVAETLAAARDAAELVKVDYDVLPAVVKIVEACDPDAPRLWPDVPNNVCLSATMGDGKAVATAFAEAHLIVERVFENQRTANCQMEPRAAIGRYDETEGYTIIAGSQGVVRQRASLISALTVAPERIRVISPDVGGGFGARTALNAEPVLVAWASRRVGRPVLWNSDRTEAFLSDYQGRDQWARVALCFDADGRILAMRSEQYGNLGAYPVSFAPLANGQRMAPTCYDIPAVLVETRGVLTNTVPTAPYRGAGRPEAHFAMERLLDLAAPKLGLDRIEIRRRNLISKARMPYRTATGLTYDSGNFVGNMDRALRLADWEGFPARRTASRAVRMRRGIGIANYVEAPVGAARERATITVVPNGDVEIISGTQSTGQGHETTFAQIVSSLLGVPPEKVGLKTGDTRFAPVGGGSHSDRSARLMGHLLFRCCAKIADRGREVAAFLLGREPGAIVFAGGRFGAAGRDQSYSLFRRHRDLHDHRHGAGRRHARPAADLRQRMRLAPSAGAERHEFLLVPLRGQGEHGHREFRPWS